MRARRTIGVTNRMAGLMIAKMSHAQIRRGTPVMNSNGNFPLLVGPAGLEPRQHLTHRRSGYSVQPCF